MIIGFSILSGTVSPDGGSSGGEVVTYGLNEPVIVDNFEYTFTSMERKDQISGALGFLNSEANGEFIILSVTIKNIGNEGDYINDEIYLVDEQGREFSQDSEVSYYLDDSFGYDELNPSLSQSGSMAFDVPVGLTGKVCIKSGVWSDKCKAYVNLS